MSIFASYFWLWSIIGLMGLLGVYTLGAVMNFGGFIAPFKRAGRWVELSPAPVKAVILVFSLGLLAYPSFVHKLWADATAHEVRRTFESLPIFPDARRAPWTEQMSGLYDPTGTDGTFIIGWYGTAASFADVRRHYETILSDRGWTPFRPESRAGTLRGGPPGSRLSFRDHSEVARSHYEVLVAQLSGASQEVPAEVAAEPTVFAVRLGVIDPRVTTQVAWFIDCLVLRAPTFPTCEAMGWNPLEPHLGTGATRPSR